MPAMVCETCSEPITGLSGEETMAGLDDHFLKTGHISYRPLTIEEETTDEPE